jgi:hypothetical protein
MAKIAIARPCEGRAIFGDGRLRREIGAIEEILWKYHPQSIYRCRTAFSFISTVQMRAKNEGIVWHER